MTNLESFINQYVIKRNESMFQADVMANEDKLAHGLNGKSVLVIGGAGSIGFAFIKSIICYKLEELVIVDTNENALAELTRFLRSSSELSECIPQKFKPYPMDFSSVTFQRMFTHHLRPSGQIGFDIIANFSAHKHVRSEKDIFSIESLLRNNVISARNLLELIANYPPETYFCVSTDKAANPANIMGASKRIMEDLIFSYSDEFSVKTARFANVAFSNGSLPAGFIERMKYHQPITAPLNIKRYFVSPKESGQICMISTVLGDNREILFPKLDKAQMTTFDRIAEDLLMSEGYEIEKCFSEAEAIEKSKEWNESQPYPVYFSKSDTSGEKDFEEFYVDEETIDLDKFISLGIITNKRIPDKRLITDLISTLDEALQRDKTKKEDIVSIIAEYLPNFSHVETGKSLDEKM